MVLGPTVAFENTAPDGPLDSVIDPPAESAKWWDYERNAAPTDVNLTRSVLAAALELKEEMLRCWAAFVVENGKWYASVIIVDLTEARDQIREWPPREAINGAISVLAFMAARSLGPVGRGPLRVTKRGCSIRLPASKMLLSMRRDVPMFSINTANKIRLEPSTRRLPNMETRLRSTIWP